MQRLHVPGRRPNARFLFVDPCAGLGRLTPTSKDVGEPCARMTWWFPVGEEIYGDYRECRETVCRKGTKWSQLKQPGVGKIHEQDFFASSSKTYGKTAKESLVFVMNPPFQLPKSKGRTTSGVLEFVKQCCRVVRKAASATSSRFAGLRTGTRRTCWPSRTVEMVTTYTRQGERPEDVLHASTSASRGEGLRRPVRHDDDGHVPGPPSRHRVGKYSKVGDEEAGARSVRTSVPHERGAPHGHHQRQDASQVRVLGRDRPRRPAVVRPDPKNGLAQTLFRLRQHGSTWEAGLPEQIRRAHRRRRRDQEYKAWGWSVRKKSEEGATGTQMAASCADVVSLGYKNISCKAKRIPWATIGPAPKTLPRSLPKPDLEPWSPASKIWKAASTPHTPAHQRLALLA